MKKCPNDARCVVWAIGEFFFECTIYFLPTTPIVGLDDAHEGPQRPMQAYEDETKMKKGPNDARCVVWAIGEFFFECTIYFLPTTPIVGPDDAHKGPQRPTAANKGQRRSTKMKKGPNDARCVVWAIGKVFFKCTIYFLPTTPIVGPDNAHKGPQQPTKANAGLQR